MIRHHIVDLEDLKQDFNEYTQKVRELKGLSNEAKLEFYGLYKQASVGPCKADKPSLFDFRGQAKFEAWQRLGELSVMDAMLQYIDLYNSLDETDLTNKEAEEDGGTKIQSTLYKEEEDLPTDENDIWHACRHGNLSHLRHIFTEEHKTVVDAEGRSLLHWAVDRNHEAIVKWLIERGIDLNLQDEDGSTALHYACTCEHYSLVTLLLASGCDVSIKDADGMVAQELCDDKTVFV